MQCQNNLVIVFIYLFIVIYLFYFCFCSTDTRLHQLSSFCQNRNITSQNKLQKTEILHLRNAEKKKLIWLTFSQVMIYSMN